MKLLVFLISYVIGISTLWMDSDSYLIYLLGLFFYLSFTDYISEHFHRHVVIEPLILSFSSSMLYSLLEQKGEMVFLQFLCVASFLVIYHHLRGKMMKIQNEEVVDTAFYVKRLLLPVVYPVAFCFVCAFFMGAEPSLYFYWMFYFLTIIYFSRYIVTTFYLGYFVLTQSFIVFYVFQFMDSMSVFSKVLVCLFFLFTACGRYVYHQAKGGRPYLPFIQGVFRKKIQKFKNR